jgi:hypothetical protein
MLPSTKFLQHEYRAHNYQYYVDLIRDLLHAEKHDELTIKNHYQPHIGAAALLEIHYNEQNQHKSNFSKDKNPKKNGKSVKRRHNRRKVRQLAKMMGKDVAPFKGGNVKCKPCGCYKNTIEKCRTPKHLVTLYQKSLGKDKKAQGSRSESKARFIILAESKFETDCSRKGPQETSTNGPTLTTDDYMDVEISMVKFALNDLFSDLL